MAGKVSNADDMGRLFPNTVYNWVMKFISSYENKSTRDNYKRYLKLMFKYMSGKELGQVTFEDIKSINNSKVNEFRRHLEDKYKNTSINQIIFTCKALFDKFKENNIVEFNEFDLKPLLEDYYSYGSLTSNEIENLFIYCLEQRHKPMTVKLYFEFLFTVTCRKYEAQNLTWNQINCEPNCDDGKNIWVISFKNNRGEEFKRAIQDSFYQQLRNNYEKENETSGKVFNANNEYYDRVLKGFCKKHGIDKERNIKQHSIRKSGLDFIQGVTGNVNLTASSGRANIQTNYKKYNFKINRYSEQPSFMLHNGYNITMLKGLGEDALIKLIERAGKQTVVKLCMELEKMTK